MTDNKLILCDMKKGKPSKPRNVRFNGTTYAHGDLAPTSRCVLPTFHSYLMTNVCCGLVWFSYTCVLNTSLKLGVIQLIDFSHWATRRKTNTNTL